MIKPDHYYIGFDIGGTKCAVVLGDNDFNIYEKITFPTRTSERGWSEVLDEFKKHATSFINKYDRNKLVKIGISCGGPLDSKKGIIYSPPNLPGWDAVPVTGFFEKALGVPAILQNDANASALAEWMLGAGKGTQNMIFLTFGTGMGSGLILDGHLYAGTNDLGGEVGHVRMAEKGPVGFNKAGSFEGFCSGGGIAQLAKKMVSEKLENGEPVAFCPDTTHLPEITAKTVFEAAQKEDILALEIVRISAEYLGKGLAILIDILNPECIVIGSIYARNEALFKPHMMKILKKEAIPAALEVCRIVPAGLGDTIGDYAALSVALNDEPGNVQGTLK
ncbi:MAG: ROK family protein [Bacteroidales bacterium]|nr:ROK family protein [Bacteroidales bacterium]